MKLMSTGAMRWAAIGTLLCFGLQASVPVAWSQTPAPPPSGAKGAPGLPPQAGGASSAPSGSAPKPAATAPRAPAAAPAGSQPETGNAPWPREFDDGTRVYTAYQPQIEKWDGVRLHARSAFSVEAAASPVQHFGVAWFSARAEVDRVNRLVSPTDFRIDKVSFPAEPDRAADYQKVLQGRLSRAVAMLSLDRVQAALAIAEAQKTGGAAPQAVKNDAPRVIVSATPAILVLVDGKPALRQVEGSALLRVVNTWALILVDQKAGKYYLRALGRWFEAGALEGPWAVSARPPATLQTAIQVAGKSQRVNFLDDPGPLVKEAADRGILPTVYVSTVPAELIQTQGRPDYEPIEGTNLLHVPNTSANVLLDTTDQRHYVLLSGRWFRTASLTQGPWEYVPHDKLPADFAKIPEGHPRGAVLASIPETPQAKEALIDNNIPQTAEVSRKNTTYRATYDGQPKFQPIEGTSLQYATNSPAPVIQVDAKTYYSLKDGVWFVAAAPGGPWTVATTVPAVIYTIPVSSPLYYVTYVQVYSSTPETVYVGYTPGYYGTVVAPGNVVVYGTGYVYAPAYVGPYWYPPPVTYGYGAGFAWGAFTGFAFGAVAAGAWGGAWGCCHDDVEINRNVNINRSDAYNRWNQDQVRSNLESRAQSAQTRATEARQGAQQRATEARQGAQQRATEARQGAQQAAQQRAGSLRSNDVYAGSDGNAYRRGAEGWEQNSGQGWNRADFSGGRESAGDLNRQQQSRSLGAARESSSQRSGGSGSFGSGGGARPSGGFSGGARGGGGRGGGGRRR